MYRCCKWRRRDAVLIAAVVCLGGLLFPAFLTQAESTPAADSKLEAAFRRSHFDRQFPPDAVKLIHDRLQNANPALDELTSLSKHETPDVRALVALVLGEYGDPACAAPLWRLLRDDSEFVRITAAGSLRRLASFTPVRLELDGLLDKRAEVRRLTAATLGSLGDKAAETALIDVLHDENELVRAEATMALSRCGTERALPSLVEALTDRNVMVRTCAAGAVARFENPATVPALINATKDPDWHVRAAAVLALGSVTRRGPDHGAAVSEVLLARLEKDEFALVRDRAADALASSDDEKAIAALVKAIASDDRDARFHAARALKSANARSAVPLLLKYKDHPNPEVRQIVVELCGVLGNQDQLPSLLKGLDDPDSNVRLTAVRALRTIEQRTSSSVDLENKLADSNPHIRAASARTLGDLGRKEAVPRLITLLRDANGYVRGAAAEALGKLGDHSAVQPLIAVLSGERASEGSGAEGLIVGTDAPTLPEIARMKAVEQKVAAVRALAVMGANEALDPIVEHGLKAPDAGLRAESAVALGVLRDPRAVGPLQAAVRPYYESAVQPEQADDGNVIAGSVPEGMRQMKEHEARVRASVAWALGQLADASTIPILSRAANDENSLVREQASEALQKISERQEQALANKPPPAAAP